jgi:hypothetical protein
MLCTRRGKEPSPFPNHSPEGVAMSDTPFSPDSLAPPRELPGWPKVVGTISIVWSSLGLLCGGCGLLMIFIGPSFMKGAEAKLGPIPPAMLPNPLQAAAGGVSLLWTIVLLTAGIFTVGRKPLGRVLHLIHAPGAIILVIVGMVLQFKQMGELKAWCAANPDNGWAQRINAPGGNIGPYVGLFFAVLGVGWALFCLAWFAPSKRSAELAMQGHFV